MADAILLIDDDPLLCRGLAYSLERQGFMVQAVPDAEQGLAQARLDRPDLVLLDIGLPGMDGLDAMRIFQRQLRLPVILLTARRSGPDEALGLELGADDYITKPYDMDRLVARVQATLRRYRRPTDALPAALLAVGGLTIDPSTRSAQIGGWSLDLQPREFDLLHTLASQAGRVLAIETLLSKVWGRDFDGQPQVVYVTISELRRALAAIPCHALRIVTVHRVGYKLVDEEA